MTLHDGWLELYWTNVANVELMTSTYVPEGKKICVLFELQSSFQYSLAV